MSSGEEDSLPPHLTEEEVLRLLDIVEKFDPVVIGGQAVNLWVQRYRARDPDFLGGRPFTSKDLDFYRNREAAEQLADELGGRVLLPEPDDATPNAAMVVGTLGGRPIEVDFMATVLGVEASNVTGRQVMLEARSPQTDRPIRILLLHPLDCVRSRLANVNTLHRYDEHSVAQAVAALEVLQRFLVELLDDTDRLRHVQTILVELHYVIRDLHAGKPTHLTHGLCPEAVLSAFHEDERLDLRWRSRTLMPCRDRVARWLRLAEQRHSGRRTDAGRDADTTEDVPS